MYKSTFGTGEEEKRLEVLHSYAILDSPPEQEWDALSELAARVSGAGISFLSFFGETACFTKAAFGLAIEEINEIPSLCQLGLRNPKAPTVLTDSKELEVAFASSPTKFRFFAGFPLVSPNGFLLGSLYVMDQNSSALDEGQVRALELLAAQVITLLEGRKKQRVLQQSFRLHRELEKQRALDRLNNDALINTTSDAI